MTSLSARIFVDLIGKPFAISARGPEAYDCLGLAMAVARRRGFNLHDYQSTGEELERQLREGVLGPCRQIERPQAGAVVLMRSPNGPAHLGVMIDGHRMLHASEQAGSVVLENLQRSFWRSRVLGFYELEVRA